MQANNGAIYAVYDILAEQIIGMLQIFRADAAAIRFFGDVASDTSTIVGKHPTDFSLIRLGTLNTDNTIEPDHTSEGLNTVITGKQWLAAQRPEGD